MSHIRPLESTYSSEIVIEEVKPTHSYSKESVDDLSKKGLALHQIFNQDILREFTPQQSEIKKPTPSLWSWMLSWFTAPDQKQASAFAPSEKIQELVIKREESISPIPNLEAPDFIPEDLKTAKFADTSKKSDNKVKLTVRNIEETLALMSDQTIESIMFIVFQTQTHLQKEHAHVAEKTYSKYLSFQKLQQEMLVEIKDILVNDKNIAKHFGTTQNLLLFVNGVTAIAAAAASFSILAPFLGFISPGALATASASSAGLTALTLGTKAYFDSLMNEHQAKHERHTHYDQHYNDRIDDSRNRLMTTAEADTVFKERWALLLRRSDKMRKLVLKK